MIVNAAQHKTELSKRLHPIRSAFFAGGIISTVTCRREWFIVKIAGAGKSLMKILII